MNGTEPPFLYRMFNVMYFFSSRLTGGRNILLRTMNAFIEGLNRRSHLPRYVIIALGADLLEMVKTHESTTGLTKQLERCISWLAKQMNNLIEARKEKNFKKKPGAMPESDNFPVLIWMELFDIPYLRNKFIQENRSKFNKGINKVTLREKNCRVMTIESLGIRHFNPVGTLNYEGKKQLWKEINYTMHEFFRKRTSLNPRYYVVNRSNQQQDQDNNSRREAGQCSRPVFIINRETGERERHPPRFNQRGRYNGQGARRNLFEEFRRHKK